MAENNDNMGKLISDALADPRFGEIFSALKSKADSGELDVSSIASAFSDGEVEGRAKKEDANRSGNLGAKDASSAPDLMEMIGPLLGSKGRHSEMEKHEKLLCALKPYLTDGKKDAVDNILKVAKVGDVLETVLKVNGALDNSSSKKT